MLRFEPILAFGSIVRVPIEPNGCSVLLYGIENVGASNPRRRGSRPRFVTAMQTSQNWLVCPGQLVGKKLILLLIAQLLLSLPRREISNFDFHRLLGSCGIK